MTGNPVGDRPGLAGPAAKPSCPAQGTQAELPKLLLTVTEAAAVLSVGRTTVFALLKAGRLDSVQIGTSRRITLRALEAYVAGLAANKAATTHKPEVAAPQPSSTTWGNPHDGERHHSRRRRHRSPTTVEVLALPFAGEVPPATT